jgi:hypothetical protein
VFEPLALAYPALTIEQMDWIKDALKPMDFDIEIHEAFVQNYFLKVFNDELDEEDQDEEDELRFQKLSKMHNYAKSRNL